jgi:hypothetical protein
MQQPVNLKNINFQSVGRGKTKTMNLPATGPNDPKPAIASGLHIKTIPMIKKAVCHG